MKFTMPQRDFASLLKVVTHTASLPKHQRDPHLRMEASNGRLFLNGNEAEANAPADVDVEGVCFLNYRRLLPLVQTFKGEKALTIEVAPGGLRIGNFRISDEIWYAIFDKPEAAPARVIGHPDPKPHKNSIIQKWRAQYGKRNEDPQGYLFD